MAGKTSQIKCQITIDHFLRLWYLNGDILQGTRAITVAKEQEK